MRQIFLDPITLLDIIDNEHIVYGSGDQDRTFIKVRDLTQPQRIVHETVFNCISLFEYFGFEP